MFSTQLVSNVLNNYQLKKGTVMTDGNPFLDPDRFDRTYAKASMSRSGVARWLLILLVVLLGTGSYTWHHAMVAFDGFDFSTLQSVPTGEEDKKGKAIKETVVVDRNTGEHLPLPQFDLGFVKRLMWLGIIGGFLCAIIIIMNPSAAPILSPVYAGLQGFALGGISAIFELQFHGIVMQAVAITVLVMLAMMALFATGILRATGGFVAGVLACMFGILGVYILDIVLRVFFGSEVGIVHSNSWAGIGFSIFVCLIAALNFVIDFDSIERGIKRGAAKHYDAYCAFSILLTLVWLYLEILRLLAKLRSNS